MPSAANNRQLFICALFLLRQAAAQVSVLTYHNDLARTGQNLAETTLTPANVNMRQFGKLFSYPVDGYIYAQPLYVPAVVIPDKGTHNAVFVATEHDSVYAFDADSAAGPNAAPLWQVSFLDPATGVTTVPYQNAFNCNQIVPEIGITGTPVIDPASGTLYVVAMTMEGSGGATTYAHRLHALDISTGAERPSSPVLIQASVPGTGDRSTTVTFIPRNYKSRPGLLLLNGVVYTSWSSHCDAGAYHGWLIGYDAQSLQQVSVYNNTPNGSQGSFWASGAAPAVDAEGNIYLDAGNGTFDGDVGGADLGESFIKLSTTAGLSVIDWFAPFNQLDLNKRDVDTGSSGTLLLPDSAGSPQHPHLLTSAGKEGRIYLLDRDNLGKFQAGSDSQIVQSLPAAVGGLFSIPAYFNGMVYFSGAGDNLKAFSIANAALSPAPISMSATKFGGLGAVPSVSANGASNGIVWVLESSGGGILRAYDAANLAAELYDSGQNRARDSLGSYVKFSTPTIANGKVYAGTQNSLAVFGLFGPPALGSSGVVNAASYQPGPVAPGSLVTLFGQNLAQTIATAPSYPLPLSLAGSSLSINGIPAPISYASPSQIDAQVPYEVAPGPANAVLTVGGVALPDVAFTVQATAPGIFMTAASAVEGMVTLYGTGQGAVDNPVATGAAAPASPPSQPIADVAATLAGQPIQISISLAPRVAGVFQLNFRIPNLATGDYPFTVTIGGAAGNSVLISVPAP
jgi:IPT/TIG domain.